MLSFVQTADVVVSLDDEYFSGCMLDLEDSLMNGWKLVDSQYDAITNSNFLTLQKEVVNA